MVTTLSLALTVALAKPPEHVTYKVVPLAPSNPVGTPSCLQPFAIPFRISLNGVVIGDYVRGTHRRYVKWTRDEGVTDLKPPTDQPVTMFVTETGQVLIEFLTARYLRPKDPDVVRAETTLLVQTPEKTWSKVWSTPERNSWVPAVNSHLVVSVFSIGAPHVYLQESGGPRVPLPFVGERLTDDGIVYYGKNDKMPNVPMPCKWSPGKKTVSMPAIKGVKNSVVLGFAGSEFAVGECWLDNDKEHRGSFLWHGDTVRYTPPPEDSLEIVATGVNRKGLTVGHVQQSKQILYGYIQKLDGAPVNFNSVLDDESAKAWTVINLFQVSDDGIVVGYAIQKDAPKVNYYFVGLPSDLPAPLRDPSKSGDGGG